VLGAVLTWIMIGLVVWLGIGVLAARLFGAFVDVGGSGTRTIRTWREAAAAERPHAQIGWTGRAYRAARRSAAGRG
jgi:hypothetical protein